MFGTWPIIAFNKLNDIEKIAFWAESGDGGQKTLLEAVEQKIIFNQVKKLIDHNVGEYLPLNVWVQKGWRAEDVLKCPKEIHA